MKPGRLLFQSHDWNGGTADEYQQAGSGYIAYCGVYEVDEEKETVTHIPIRCAGAKSNPQRTAAVGNFERRPADSARCCSCGEWHVGDESAGVAKS